MSGGMDEDIVQGASCDTSRLFRSVECPSRVSTTVEWWMRAGVPFALPLPLDPLPEVSCQGRITGMSMGVRSHFYRWSFISGVW